MPEMTLAAATVQVDDEGYMTDPAEWTPEIAEAMAREEGLDALTDRHWVVVNFAREDYQAKGETPGLRRISKRAGVPTKELYQLFPGGPGKKVARIAGLPKPKGCV